MANKNGQPPKPFTEEEEKRIQAAVDEYKKEQREMEIKYEIQRRISEL